MNISDFLALRPSTRNHTSADVGDMWRGLGAALVEREAGRYSLRLGALESI